MTREQYESIGRAFAEGVEAGIREVQEIKNACIVCCPMCDEKECVGRYNCTEIKQYIETHKK